MIGRARHAQHHRPILRFALARVRSLSHAVAGLGFMFRTQPHARLHALATLLVAATGTALRIPLADWAMLVLVCALVLAAEAVNTAMEHLCDVVCPTWSESVRRAKDVAAGAVLICAIAAAMVGTIIVAKNLVSDDEVGVLSVKPSTASLTSTRPARRSSLLTSSHMGVTQPQRRRL